MNKVNKMNKVTLVCICSEPPFVRQLYAFYRRSQEKGHRMNNFNKINIFNKICKL